MKPVARWVALREWAKARAEELRRYAAGATGDERRMWWGAEMALGDALREMERLDMAPNEDRPTANQRDTFGEPNE